MGTLDCLLALDKVAKEDNSLKVGYLELADLVN